MANNAIQHPVQKCYEEVTNTRGMEAKLIEDEEITAELYEESKRYETDKEQMVEAMDAMLNDTIKTELEEFAQTNKAVVAQVEYIEDFEHAKS